MKHDSHLSAHLQTINKQTTSLAKKNIDVHELSILC